jgi:hypothetical protein
VATLSLDAPGLKSQMDPDFGSRPLGLSGVRGAHRTTPARSDDPPRHFDTCSRAGSA